MKHFGKKVDLLMFIDLHHDLMLLWDKKGFHVLHHAVYLYL